MKINHSKYKNTGLIFEFLVRQITSDTLSGKNSKASNIIKKYFVKTELSKEYKLYETLIKKNNLTEGKANNIIDALLEASKKLNRSSLKREKYNVIKEIKEYYNIDEFFKNQLPNYKIYASFYILNELHNQNHNPLDLITYKNTLLEYLTSQKPQFQNKDLLIEEFSSNEKDVRILVYRILLEKFNEKHKDLNPNQKRVLKEYIYSIDSTPTLKNFYNSEVLKIKKILSEINKKTTDKSTHIKIKEICNLLCEAGKNQKITDKDLINVLQYYSLIDELKKANG
jgi:hypothetical protein